jgi:hypothetical protein
MLLFLKIAVTPLLVAGLALATRWWGPTVGGVLIGLPWFTGPTLFILIQERGGAFGVGACLGVELGVLCISAFMLVYGLVAAIAGWPVSLAAAAAAFFSCAALVSDPAMLPAIMPAFLPPLWTAAGMAILALCLVLALLPRPRAAIPVEAPPWWDIPARIVTAAALVATLVLSADALGPALAGVLATYPIVLTVTGTFTHHRWGRDAVWRVLRGLAQSLFGFVAFFLVAGLTLPVAGLVGAYALAMVTALAITAGLVVAHRLKDARRARPAEAVRQPG